MRGDHSVFAPNIISVRTACNFWSCSLWSTPYPCTQVIFRAPCVDFCSHFFFSCEAISSLVLVSIKGRNHTGVEIWKEFAYVYLLDHHRLGVSGRTDSKHKSSPSSWSSSRKKSSSSKNAAAATDAKGKRHRRRHRRRSMSGGGANANETARHRRSKPHRRTSSVGECSFRVVFDIGIGVAFGVSTGFTSRICWCPKSNWYAGRASSLNRLAARRRVGVHASINVRIQLSFVVGLAAVNYVGVGICVALDLITAMVRRRCESQRAGAGEDSEVD